MPRTAATAGLAPAEIAHTGDRSKRPTFQDRPRIADSALFPLPHGLPTVARSGRACVGLNREKNHEPYHTATSVKCKPAGTPKIRRPHPAGRPARSFVQWYCHMLRPVDRIPETEGSQMESAQGRSKNVGRVEPDPNIFSLPHLQLPTNRPRVVGNRPSVGTPDACDDL